MTSQADAHPRLRAMIEAASRNIEVIFGITGEVAPMWHFTKANGNEFAMLAPDTDDKDIATAIVRAVFEVEDVVRYVFMTEAWVVETHDPVEIEEIKVWIAQGRSARDHPKRREIVMFVAEDATGQLTGQREIERKGKRPRLGSLQIDEFTQSEGRIIGMLPRRREARLQ